MVMIDVFSDIVLPFAFGGVLVAGLSAIWHKHKFDMKCTKCRLDRCRKNKECCDE